MIFKSTEKSLNVLRMKKVFKVKQKTFFIIFKRLSLKEIKPALLEVGCWSLTLSWRRSLSNRNQSINLLSKSMNWLLYDRDLYQERVKKKMNVLHCVKSVRIRSYSGPYFPAFGLNIQSECGKIRTRIIPNTDTLYAVLWFQ